MYLKLLIALTIVFQVATAAKSEIDELFIELSTKQALKTVYLSDVITYQNDSWDQYGSQLKQVLKFDFENSGRCQLQTNLSELESALKSLPYDQKINIETLKKCPADIMVMGEINDGKFWLKVFDLKSMTAKSTEKVALSKNIAQDRRLIHRLGDMVQKNLFGEAGISSYKFLFSEKKATGSSEEKWGSDIYQADYDGHNKQLLTQNGGYSISPIYIPSKPGYKSGGFIYVSYKQGQPKIYISSLTNFRPTPLIALKGNQFMPAVNLKKSKLAFISDVTGNPDLFLCDFDPGSGTIGKPTQAYSARPASQGSPTFSPDGSKIAFVSNKDGTPKIYCIDTPEPRAKLKDIKPLLITKRNRENSAPSWSPDGRFIIYRKRENDRFNIFIQRVGSEEVRQLTFSGRGHSPAWSPYFKR